MSLCKFIEKIGKMQFWIIKFIDCFIRMNVENWDYLIVERNVGLAVLSPSSLDRFFLSQVFDSVINLLFQFFKCFINLIKLNENGNFIHLLLAYVLYIFHKINEFFTNIFIFDFLTKHIIFWSLTKRCF